MNLPVHQYRISKTNQNSNRTRIQKTFIPYYTDLSQDSHNYKTKCHRDYYNYSKRFANNPKPTNSVSGLA